MRPARPRGEGQARLAQRVWTDGVRVGVVAASTPLALRLRCSPSRRTVRLRPRRQERESGACALRCVIAKPSKRCAHQPARRRTPAVPVLLAIAPPAIVQPTPTSTAPRPRFPAHFRARRTHAPAIGLSRAALAHPRVIAACAPGPLQDTRGTFVQVHSYRRMRVHQRGAYAARAAAFPVPDLAGGGRCSVHPRCVRVARFHSACTGAVPGCVRSSPSLCHGEFGTVVRDDPSCIICIRPVAAPRTCAGYVSGYV